MLLTGLYMLFGRTVNLEHADLSSSAMQDACAGGQPGRPGLLRRLFGQRPRRRPPQAPFESFAAAQGRDEGEDAPLSIVILNLLSHAQLVSLLAVCPVPADPAC